jgi:hypothetical protein
MATRGLTAVIAGLLVTGCGSSASPPVTPTQPAPPSSLAYVPSQGKVAACAHAAKAIPLPARFPAEFPFPANTIIDRTGALPHGQKGVGIYGFVPSTGFAATVNFFRHQVPRHGFKLLYLEVDSPHDSEGQYRGFGQVGEWQLRALPGCPLAMSLAVSAEPGNQKP